MSSLHPRFRITYNGEDITEDITSEVIAVTYNDRTEGASDELSIEVDNSSGKWADSWYPNKGDTLTLEIGYDNDIVPCGSFTIDELEISGPPDKISIRALAAGINSPLRTKKSKGYEGQTLRELADEIAERNGLTVEDGTSRGFRTKYDFIEERKLLKEGAQAVRTTLKAVENSNLATVKFGFAKLAEKYYPLMIQVEGSLATKGEFELAQQLGARRHFFRTAVGVGVPRLITSLSDILAARKQIQDFAAWLDAAASSLEDVDFTVTKSRLDISIGRRTQSKQTDLAFLNEVAREFGVMFNVRGEKLIFLSIYDIEGFDPILSIDKTQVKSYQMKDKATKVYTRARVRYHNPEEAQVVEASIEAADLPNDLDTGSTSGDALEIHVRAENVQQAEEKAKAALHQANSNSQIASISLAGNPYLLAGVNVICTGFGKMDGRWHVKESSHALSPGAGYLTTAQLKRIGAG